MNGCHLKMGQVSLGLKSGLTGVQVVRQRGNDVIKGQQIALGTKPGDRADSLVGEIRLVAERLAGMHIGQMHLDKRDIQRQHGIAQCNAGVRTRRRIYNQKIKVFATCCMQSLDQRTFMVTLKGFQYDASTFGAFSQGTINISQGRCTIEMWFTLAEQIQVRAVQYQNLAQRFGGGLRTVVHTYHYLPIGTNLPVSGLSAPIQCLFNAYSMPIRHQMPTRCESSVNPIELLEGFCQIRFQILAGVNTKVTAADLFFRGNDERKGHGIMTVA